jgi:hypothetical protein
MDETVQNSEFDYDSYEATFIKSLRLINGLGDNNKVFRNEKNLFVPANFEGILIGLAQNIEKYADNPELLKSRIDELKKDTNFKKFSGTASNSKSRIKNRLKRANEIFQS